MARLVKGVYANLEEFKNNAPSILQYDVSKDKSGDVELRIPDESGHLYYTHTVCVHHQFYVLGSKEYRNKKLWVPFIILIGPLALVYGATDVSDNVVRTLRLFRLNVKTGRVTE